MASVKEDTIKSVKWSAIEKFSLQAMQFVLGLIMARLLLPSDYGTIGMLAIFIAISQTFVDSGFGSALVRKLDRTETDFSTVFFFNLFVAILLYVILFFSAPLIAGFFDTPILCPILRVQATTLILGALMGIHNAKLTINLDFKAIAKISVSSTLLSGVVGIVCAYNGLGVWALVVQTVLGQIINMVSVWFYLRWRPQWVFSKQSFKELGSFGSKLLVSSLLHTIFSNLTTLIIGKFFSARDLGFYNRGTQFAQLPVSTMNGVIGKVMYPILVKLQNDDEHLVSVYRKYICVMSIPIFFGCVLLASVAKPLIVLLLTDRWIESVIYLQIFAFAIMFDHICSINLELLKVKGRSDLFLRLEIIKKAISVSILFASIPFGVLGICVSKLIYTQIAIFINTYYTGKLFNLGYITQIRDFSIYFIKSLLACLPGYVICTFTHLPNIMALLIGFLIGTLLYIILLRNDKNALEVYQLAVSKFNFKRK